MKVLKDENSQFCKYKYHVESPVTEKGSIKSLEFIVGPTTSGGIIDRFLKVHCIDGQLKTGCKWLNIKLVNIATVMFCIMKIFLMS